MQAGYVGSAKKNQSKLRLISTVTGSDEALDWRSVLTSSTMPCSLTVVSCWTKSLLELHHGHCEPRVLSR